MRVRHSLHRPRHLCLYANGRRRKIDSTSLNSSPTETLRLQSLARPVTSPVSGKRYRRASWSTAASPPTVDRSRVTPKPQATASSMPKKRNSNFKRLQGSSSINTHAPSSVQLPIHHGRPGGVHHETPASVNEQLNQLRSVPTPESQRKKRDLAESANRPSVPPHLRSILGVPESAPPRPKLGARFRDRMRTPGPAPPKSWLGFTPAWEAPLTAKQKGKQMAGSAHPRKRPETLLRFVRMTDATSRDARSGSLTHMTLRRLAETWYMLDQEDYPVLVEVPLRLRLQLLSYMGFYGDPIDALALEALTQGVEDVKSLDLGGLAGYEPLTLKRINRILEGGKRASTGQQSEAVADSWDAEDASETAPALSTSISRFANLTHLCLSHPPPTAHWRDLLGLSKHVPQLTHLSLAHWPRPTLTPNLVTATVSSRNSPDVRAGGSHIYSAMEQDLTEPASLLRQLSGNLLCLQWLDLEGCAEWMPALSILAASAVVDSTIVEAPRNPGNGDDWLASKPSVMTIFTDTWKNLHYLRCSQSWLPTAFGIESLGMYLNSDIRQRIVEHLHRTEAPRAITNDIYEVEKRQARIWMDSEARLLAAGRRINNIRRARACKPVMFDYGWFSKAV